MPFTYRMIGLGPIRSAPDEQSRAPTPLGNETPASVRLPLLKGIFLVVSLLLVLGSWERVIGEDEGYEGQGRHAGWGLHGWEHVKTRFPV
jgi:hypothetical protein